MTMKLSILVTSNGKQAKADVAEIEAAIGKLGKSAKITSIETQGAAKSTGMLGAAAGQAEAKVDVLTRAQAQQAATAMRMAQANDVSAGSLGNIAAQFNDIGVMLAAGQNPFQLALQQGTQLNQVLGPLGVKGALTAMRSALVSMINPMSLLTIGTIAAGAALVQWLTRADEAEDAADRLAEKLEKVRDAQASLTNELRQTRLGVSEEELTLIDAIAAKKREIAEQEERVQMMAGTRRYADQLAGEERVLAALRQESEEYNHQLARLRDLQAQKERIAAVTAETADQERLLGEQMLLTGREIRANEQIAELLKAGIAASVIEAMQLAGIDMASPISSAAAEAAKLASNLNIAYGEAVKLQFARSQPYVSSGRGKDPRQFEKGGLESSRFIPSQAAVRGAQNLLFPTSGASGGGSGGGARTRIDEVQRLTDRLQDQLDVLRATDPIQKELIRNRKALSKATEEQKEKITDLITQHYEEQKALEQKQELWSTVESTAGSIIDGLTDRTKSLSDVLKDAAGNLAGLVAQSAITGKGVFGGLFGGVGIGQLLFPAKKADGGMIYGQGGGRDDKVPLWGSAGEFMVNARATARHRALLERINAGMPVQRLATGGVVGGSIMRPAQNVNAAPVMHNHFDLRGARGNQEIMEAVREGMELALETFSREELPGRFAEISDNPRMVG